MQELIYLSNMVVKPDGAVLSNNVAIITIVVTGHMSKDLVHSVGRNLGQERCYEILVDQVWNIYKAFINITIAADRTKTHELYQPMHQLLGAHKTIDGR